MFLQMFSPLENAGNALIILKNSERHHSISKSHHSSTCNRFKGIFVHSYDIFSGKCLHKICSTLSSLSISTWITQFGHLWKKLSPKQENYPNMKSCDIWHLLNVADSWNLDESSQKGRGTTREEAGWLVKIHSSSNKSKTPFKAPIKAKNMYKTQKQLM